MTSSEQARADAMADAETLLRISYVETHDYAGEAWNLGGWVIYAIANNLDPEDGARRAARAAFLGIPELSEHSCQPGNYPDCCLSGDGPDDDAFRAVPGLRG